MQKLFLLFLILLGSSFGMAQVFNPEAYLKEAQMRAAAVRAARIDALRQLGESIKSVRITSRTTVKDFVTESDEISAQFDAFLQGAQQEGKPMIYDDGTVEVKMAIYVDAVAQGLQKIAQNSSVVSPSQVANATKSPALASMRKFVATGSGAMKTTPSNLPQVDLWKYVSVSGRLMARRAAQVDAYRNMAETIYGVQLDSKTEIKDFVASSDAIKASFNGLVQGVQFESQTVYRPDGLVEVTAFMDVKTLEHFLTRMSAYTNKGVDAQDIQNLRFHFPNGVVKATGVGAPPLRFISRTPGSSTVPTEADHIRVPGTPDPSKNNGMVQDPNAGKPFDPNAGKPFDPNAGKPFDPNAGKPIDPNTGKPFDPNATKPFDPNAGKPVDPNAGKPIVPTAPDIAGPPVPPGTQLEPPVRPELPPLPKVPERFVPEWANRYITATGNGGYPDNMEVGQAMAMARRAAQVDAYRLLAENAFGVRLEGETTVKEYLAEKDEIKSRLNDAFIRGAETVQDRDLRDQRAFEVDMKLYLGYMWEIVDAEYNKFLIEKYGKVLDSRKPDTTKYEQSFASYAQRLQRYAQESEEYQVKLQAYLAQNSGKLSLDFANARQYKAQAQQYQASLGTRRQTHQQYDQKLAQYRKELLAYLEQYKNHNDRYRSLYDAYKNEADAAVMPAPPAPPVFSYTGPKGFGLPPLPKVPQRFVPEWANKHIQATGTGAYPPGMDIGQAVPMAKRAAQVDAYRLLVESAKGVHLQGETSVKEFLALNDTISARVNDSFLRGAEVINEKDVRQDRYYQVEMKLYLGYMWEIIDASYNKVLVEKYGKKLEEFQPDQVRYKNEIELYESMLRKYKGQYQGYQEQLDAYYVQQSKKLALDYRVPKRYKGLYDKYKGEVKGFDAEYRKNAVDFEKYRAEMQRRQAEYEKQKRDYQALYDAYGKDANAAMMPPPPMPPTLSLATPQPGRMPKLPQVPQRFVPDWAKKDITAKGTGSYRKDLADGQAMAMARRAAQVDAYRVLVESAMGVHLQSDTTVKEFITQSDAMTARVNESFLRGAQTIKEQDYPNDGYFEVTMKLHLGDMWEILDAAYNKVLAEKFGKKIEEYQPDQVRYNTELELYKAQLAAYKEKSIAYQKQLQEYYASQRNNLAVSGNKVAGRYKSEYEKYQKQAQDFNATYQQTATAVDQYQKEMQKQQAEYERLRREQEAQKQAYAKEAEVAMVPAPPMPPEVSFNSPKASRVSFPKPPQRFVPDWAKKDITASGTGAYPPNRPDGQAMALARRAAQVDAYRVLVESAMGVRITSETSVQNFLTQKDELTARVKDSFLRGAQEIGEKDVPERRYYQVTMKLNLGDMWELIDAEYNKTLMQDYGKKLEDYQPDQLRFKTEMELYQVQLNTYKTKVESYLKQVQQYRALNSQKIQIDHPIANKHRAELQKFEQQAKEMEAKYRQYQQEVTQYNQAKNNEIAEFQQNQAAYQKQYETYKKEAEIALIPAPPTPPALAFDGPKTGDSSIPKPPERFVPDWAKKEITATGTGVYPPDKPASQGKLLAQRAAQVDAYRLLVESAVGVRLKSETSVKNFLTQKDTIEAKVNDVFLKGAQFVSATHVPERNYCKVTMKLYLGDMWEIIDAEYNKVLMKDYGQKLEDFQPDQARYRTEMELFEARLRSYKEMASAYAAKLREYSVQYGSKLETDHPVTRKYKEQYQKYAEQASGYDSQYLRYQRDLESYRQEKERQKVEFEQYKQQYQEKYNQYEREAASK